MFQSEQYEALRQRRAECEELAKTSKDHSIKQKFAKLADEYRSMADRMKLLDAIEVRLS